MSMSLYTFATTLVLVMDPLGNVPPLKTVIVDVLLFAKCLFLLLFSRCFYFLVAT